MHETEKQKINLIYNHNFQEKFDFLLCKITEIKTIVRASRASFRQRCKILGYTTIGKGLFRSYLPYSNQFRQVLGKIINPMQPLAEQMY